MTFYNFVPIKCGEWNALKVPCPSHLLWTKGFHCAPKDVSLHNPYSSCSYWIGYLLTPIAFGPCIDTYHFKHFFLVGR